MAKFNFFGIFGKSNPKPQPQTDKGIDDRPNVTALPSGRSSIPTHGGMDLLSLGSNFATVTPQFLADLIPIIRKLAQYNPDVSQAVHNIVSLGNTGHKIFFDRGVPQDQVDKMRNHLMNKRKNWAPGQAGVDGLVNKMFAQIMISGALSNEWVPNNTLSGIQGCMLVNPENIRFKLDKTLMKYAPYQKVTHGVFKGKSIEADLKPLNENTYKYYALNGDEELPYGIPPYLPVLGCVATQNKMNTNIEFIIDVMGLLGFLEAMIQKPDQLPGEKDDAYFARLTNLVNQAKSQLASGIKDGIVVGFKDDHEFKFNTASKSYESVVELYKANELQVASALKQDASLWGRDYGTSQGTMGIVFMKMLSELKNVQTIIKTNLEYGYALELRLAGYKFDYLTVQFNRSTIQDDLKYQQAEEIKVRNVKDKRLMGLISQDQAADELGYEIPYQQDAIVDWEVIAGVSPKNDQPGLATDKSAKKKTAKAKKNKSARTSRAKKSAPTGKIGK